MFSPPSVFQLKHISVFQIMLNKRAVFTAVSLLLNLIKNTDLRSSNQMLIAVLQL